MKKITMVLVIIALAAVLFTGCGGAAEIAKPAMAEGATPFTVEGSCEAVLSGDGATLTVGGTTNLMNGTNGIISVLSSDGTTVEEHKFTKESDAISYDFPVTDEWPETVYGFIAFDTQQADKQPAEVTDAYGKKFQNLEGDNVIWDLKGVIAVFQSEAVKVR